MNLGLERVFLWLIFYVFYNSFIYLLNIMGHCATKQQIEQYSKTLGIRKQNQQNLEDIKEAYRKKMIDATEDRERRSRLNKAYLQGLQHVLKTKAPELLRKIALGETNQVSKLLKSDSSLLDKKIFDYCPLYYAARSGHDDIVLMMIEMGCSLSFIGQKSTPLHCAAYYGHSRIVKILLQRGCAIIKNTHDEYPVDQSANQKVRAVFAEHEKKSVFDPKSFGKIDYQKILQIPPDKKNNFAAVKAAFRTKMIKSSQNFKERVNLNLAYLCATETIYKTKSPNILWAIAGGLKNEVEKILKQDKYLLNTPIFEYPPLYYAARSGHEDIVQLIIKMGCSLKYQGQKGTPMHCASYYGHKKIILMLIIYGMSVNIKNSINKMPIDESANDEIRRIFIAHEKPSNLDDISIKIQQEKFQNVFEIDQKEKSNMVVIKSAFRRKMIEASQDFVERVRLNKAYLNASEYVYKSKSPQLLWAIANGDKRQVQNLLKGNKSLIDTKIFNFVPLYYAARSGHQDIVQLILKMGCSKKFDDQDSTPMHGAAYYGHYDIITLLLQYGIPTSIKNIHGNLPIEDSATEQIRQLLSDNEKDKVLKLSIVLANKSHKNTLFYLEKDSKTIGKKIIINKNYYLKFDNHEDAFHGTKYEVLEPIVQYGMKKPGDIVGTVPVKVVPGHIDLHTKFRGVENWANAIFVSPSIYYSAHYVYSKQFISEDIAWMPILQLKVQKSSIAKYQHTLSTYILKKDEPKQVQYRIENNKEKEKAAEYKNQPTFPVTVVALIFLKKGFLDSNPNYTQITQLMLNSSKEQSIKTK